MAYVIVDGDTGGNEALVQALGKEVGEVFSLPPQDVVAVAHAGSSLKVLANGKMHDIKLEITVEGAGVGEEGIQGIVKRITQVAAKASGYAPGEIMVLVKIPGGPHMKNTSRCCGIGGLLILLQV